MSTVRINHRISRSHPIECIDIVNILMFEASKERFQRRSNNSRKKSEFITKSCNCTKGYRIHSLDKRSTISSCETCQETVLNVLISSNKNVESIQIRINLTCNSHYISI